ncbi:hypothetical protein [Agrococcus citreus]|uniref:DUF2946 domain-containing protein n=1 Tax=Agrococcus citreus TaxID=84643 RepID=A0ABN1Z0E8_9MICO
MRWRVLDAPGRPGLHPVRALVLIGAIVTLLIVGLLGMHAMGGASTSHGASGGSHTGIAIPASAAHASPDGVEIHEHPAASAADAHGAPAAAMAASSAAHCADCQGTAPLAPGHTELMACVLALLVGMLVLMPPSRVGLARLPSLVMPTSERASAVRLGAPRPSLNLLSISRT